MVKQGETIRADARAHTGNGTIVVLLIFAFGYISNAKATAVASGEILWNTFTVLANGNDVTDLINWNPSCIDPLNLGLNFQPCQADDIEVSYWEGDASNGTTLDHSIEPNENWAVAQSTSDGGLVSQQVSVVGQDRISLLVDAAYTSSSAGNMGRYGEFLAPAAGAYTFSVQYSARAMISSEHSELNSNNALRPTARMTPQLIYTTGASGNIASDTAEIINAFSDAAVNGTLSLTTPTFAVGDPVAVLAILEGEVRSFSTEPIPVIPLPAPLLLLASAAGLLLRYQARAQRPSP